MELEEKLAVVEAELAAAKEKLANPKEFTLQEAHKLIEGRGGKVFFTQEAYKADVAKQSGVEGLQNARNAERRHIEEVLGILGFEIPEKIPTENENGIPSFKDVLKYVKTEAKNIVSEVKSKSSSKDETNEKLLEKEKALQLIKEELQEVKANSAKLLKDLSAKDEYSANLKKAMHEAKTAEIFNTAVEKELEKYAFTNEVIKSLFKKEIESKLSTEFETEIDESGKFRVFEKYEYEGKTERLPSKDPSQSISEYVKGLEILKELTPKDKEKQAAVKTTQKQVQNSNDKSFNPLTNGTESPRDQWLKKINELGLGVNTNEATALKAEFGILTEADKAFLPK